LAKASFVGAKTVNGPGPERVSTRLAALSAVTSVERSGKEAARPTMFFVDVVDLFAIALLCADETNARASSETRNDLIVD